MPRAAEMPTRSPVKLPGPVVTAMRSSCGERQLRPRAITLAISGISASAWPRTIGSDSARQHAVLGVEHGGGAGFERGVDGKHTHG